MELCHSWYPATHFATKEFPSILWNPKLHYRVHKSSQLVPILSHINSAHTSPSYLRSILILFFHLRLGPPSGLFPSDFPTNSLHAFLFSHSCYMPSPSHPLLLIILGEEYKLWSSSIYSFSPTSCHFIPLRSKYCIPLNSLFSNSFSCIIESDLKKINRLTPVPHNACSWSRKCNVESNPGVRSHAVPMNQSCCSWRWCCYMFSISDPRYAHSNSGTNTLFARTEVTWWSGRLHKRYPWFGKGISLLETGIR
jgi:hypothetical protein